MLILRVVRPESAASAGAPVRIGVAGGTIGRAAECTLVLPDPRKHVSRVQAEIRWAGSAWALVDILHRAGLPKGVLNLVMGRGSEVGQAILEHKDVSAVTFTGSVSTGRKVAAACVASTPMKNTAISRTMVSAVQIVIRFRNQE